MIGKVCNNISLKKYDKIVYDYSTDLVNSQISKLSSTPNMLTYTSHSARANINNYALFAGGLTDITNSDSCVSRVEAWNDNLIATNITPLPNEAHWLSAAETKEHVFFAGGFTTNYGRISDIVIYDKNLVSSATPLKMTNGRPAPGIATNALDSLFIIGGYNIMTTEKFDKNLVKTEVVAIGMNGGGTITSISLDGYVVTYGSSTKYTTYQGLNIITDDLVSVQHSNRVYGVDSGDSTRIGGSFYKQVGEYAVIIKDNVGSTEFQGGMFALDKNLVYTGMYYDLLPLGYKAFTNIQNILVTIPAEGNPNDDMSANNYKSVNTMIVVNPDLTYELIPEAFKLVDDTNQDSLGRRDFKVASTKNKLIVAGGVRDNLPALDTEIYEFKPISHEVSLNKDDLYSFNDYVYSIAKEDTTITLPGTDTLYVKQVIAESEVVSTLEVKAVSNTPNIDKVTGAPTLHAGKVYPAAGTVSKYAVIAGGHGGSGSTYYAQAESYTENLIKGSLTALPSVRTYPTGASTQNYMFALGGYYGSSNAQVVGYNKNLAQNYLGAVLTTARCYIAPAVNNEDTLFCLGGFTGNGTTGTATVDMFKTDLVKVQLTNLSTAKCTTATNIGDYVIAAGGGSNTTPSTAYATVDAYDSTGTKRALPNLPYAIAFTNNNGNNYTSIGEYGMFGGGQPVASGSTSTYMYDSNLVRTNGPSLSSGYFKSVITLNGKIFFATKSSSASYRFVDAIDENLILSTASPLTRARINHSATYAGNRIFVVGGGGGGSYYADVDVYNVSTGKPLRYQIGKNIEYSLDNVNYEIASEDIEVEIENGGSVYLKYTHDKNIIL